MASLGTIKKIDDLRSVWPHEAIKMREITQKFDN